MPLDKDLYRKAYAYYRQWNEAKLVERARNAGQLSPADAWRQYIDLFEFFWQMPAQPGQWQRKQKLMHLDRYYAQVQTLEAWRRARGRTS